jgi:hypothetical protein
MNGERPAGEASSTPDNPPDAPDCRLSIVRHRFIPSAGDPNAS